MKHFTIFLKDLFILLQEKYDESLAEESKPASESDVAYRKGATFAYYDVLDLIKSQLIGFGYEKEASGFGCPNLATPLRRRLTLACSGRAISLSLMQGLPLAADRARR